MAAKEERTPGMEQDNGRGVGPEGSGAAAAPPSELAEPPVEQLREVNERLLIASLRERELAETSETERDHLATILASIGDAVVVVARTGLPARTNAAYDVLFGANGMQTLPPQERLFDRSARGEAFSVEFSAPAPDGAPHWWEAQGDPIAGGGGGVIVIRDVSARKEREASLQHQAMHDPLTGLPNRTLLFDRLERATRSTRRSGAHLALLLLDLDHFKEVNDTHGHHAGDALLREVATRMSHALRDSDTIARLGGDEFAILLPGTDREGALAAATTLRAALAQTMVIEGTTMQVAVSIGVALSSGRETDAQLLPRQADSAMYEAKRTGCGYAVFDDNAD